MNGDVEDTLVSGDADPVGVGLCGGEVFFEPGGHGGAAVGLHGFVVGEVPLVEDGDVEIGVIEGVPGAVVG